MSIVHEAWARYLATIEELRGTLEAMPRFRESPADRAKAYHALMEGQAMAYNWAIAPRLFQPRLYRNLTWQSDVYTLGTNCQDFLYYVTFLDGRQRYRLRGRRGDVCVSMVQVFDGVWGGPDFRTTGNYSLDDFAADDEGRFDIELGPDGRDEDWIELDRESTFQMVVIRRILPDWDSDAGELALERISEIPDDFYDEDEFSEHAMAARIDRASAVLRHFVGTFCESLYDNSIKLAGGQKNVLAFFPGEAIGVGGSPVSNYAMGVFEIADDEALLIDMQEPDGTTGHSSSATSGRDR